MAMKPTLLCSGSGIHPGLLFVSSAHQSCFSPVGNKSAAFSQKPPHAQVFSRARAEAYSFFLLTAAPSLLPCPTPLSPKCWLLCH